jgi:hypothetical protein
MPSRISWAASAAVAASGKMVITLSPIVFTNVPPCRRAVGCPRS